MQCRFLVLQAPGRGSDTVPPRVTFNVVETHKNMYLETEIQRGPDTKFQKQD